MVKLHLTLHIRQTGQASPSKHRSIKKSSEVIDDVIDPTSSRPMSPIEQISVIQAIENKSVKDTEEPSEEDLKVYEIFMSCFNVFLQRFN